MGRMWDEKMENLYDEPKKYGTKPENLGHFDLRFPEFMFYLYLPIKLAGEAFNVNNIPANLSFMTELLEHVDSGDDDYVYVTAKNMWFEAGQTYNREGWHSDGFMTDDINYVWCDKASTEFMSGSFDLPQDHEDSLTKLEYLGSFVPSYILKSKSLLRLDQYVIHRPPPVRESGMRGFIKISVSKDKYNLKGNSHNHLLNYKWDMCERAPTRNDPICKIKEN